MVLNPTIVKKAKLVTSGSSVVVTVPQEWMKENNLKAGEEILVIANGDLIIKKMNEENIKNIRNQLDNNHVGSPATSIKNSRDLDGESE